VARDRKAAGLCSFDAVKGQIAPSSGIGCRLVKKLIIHYKKKSASELVSNRAAYFVSRIDYFKKVVRRNGLPAGF